MTMDDARNLAEISIHAPAKGATPCHHIDPAGFLFQSTLPRRERLTSLIDAADNYVFQSTLPRRERRRG